ncbi:hypothetical protein BDV93DRAFT_558729 [Ceratobasidium sp. AG-I]|nr:hypothetical protein BDV93DRAFT_558729 [Ceratobasidium sp. AG-I]
MMDAARARIAERSRNKLEQYLRVRAVDTIKPLSPEELELRKQAHDLAQKRAEEVNNQPSSSSQGPLSLQQTAAGQTASEYFD